MSDHSVRSVIEPVREQPHSWVDVFVIQSSHAERMSASSDTENELMKKINVGVPETLLTQLDEEWERRGYSSKSEAIRDALRDWVNPLSTPSEETIEDLETGREQLERGETRSLEDLVDEYGVNLDES